MDAAQTLRRARQDAGLSLRELAARAGTSHSTLSAYEAGRKSPSVRTLDRIVRAAGFELDRVLCPRWRHQSPDDAAPSTPALDRGTELMAVLELAAAFPAHHDAELQYPVFGR